MEAREVTRLYVTSEVGAFTGGEVVITVGVLGITRISIKNGWFVLETNNNRRYLNPRYVIGFVMTGDNDL